MTSLRTPSLHELNDYLALPTALNNIVFEYIGNPFITTWHAYDSKIRLPIPYSPQYDFIVEWGDGHGTRYNHSEIEHLYSKPGIYTIYIYNLTCIRFSDFKWTEHVNNCDKILDISQWGGLKLSSGNRAFAGCSNLNIRAIDAPDLRSATNLSQMFLECHSLNCDMHWDTSTITNMNNMFGGCISFNGDISKWDVRNVTNTENMFNNCAEFKCNLSNWNVGKVTRMRGMFRGCDKFNCDLPWDTHNALYLDNMFRDCKSFNGDISKWDVSAALKISYMFRGCSSFNCNLNNWKIPRTCERTTVFHDCPMHWDLRPQM